MSGDRTKCLCCRVKFEGHEALQSDQSSVTQENLNNLDEGIQVNKSSLGFDALCNVLGLPKPCHEISATWGFEFDEGGSPFCNGCSEVLHSLEALQDLLEKTKSSLQEKLEWIRKTVDTAVYSVQDVQEDEGDDPRFRFIRTQIQTGGQRWSQVEMHDVNGVEPMKFMEHGTEEEEVEIKLESPNMTGVYDHFEVGEFQFEGSDENSPADMELEDCMIFPRSLIPDEEELAKVQEESIEPLTSPKRTNRSKGVPIPRPPILSRSVETNKPQSTSGEIAHNSNYRNYRPRRHKRKSSRLIGYEDPMKIELQKGVKSKSIIRSELELLSRFGLDDLPELRIELQDIYRDSHRLPILKKRQQNKRNLKVLHPSESKLGGQDASVHLEGDEMPSDSECSDKNSPDEEEMSDFQFRPKTLKTQKRRVPERIKKSAGYKKPKNTRITHLLIQKSNTNKCLNQKRKCRNTNQKKSRQSSSSLSVKNQKSDLLSPTENVHDPDFAPTSDDEENSSNSDSASDSSYEFSSETKNTEYKTTSKKANSKRTDGLERNARINEIRRRREHLRNSIVTENGKRYYRKQEIVEEGNFLLCTFKTCDFKLLKNKDDTKSCNKLLQHFKTVHANDNYWCAYCERFFQKKRDYCVHREDCHPTLTVELIECNICQKPLKGGNNSTSYNKHQWTHLNVEERAALVAAGNVDPLSESMQKYRKYKEDSPHQCAVCGKRFPVLFYLKIHEETHFDKSQRKKFICEKCGDVFVTAPGLYYHKMRVHNPEEFLSKWKVCLICDKKYLVQTHLDIHMRRHHGAERVHKCDKCDKAFADQHSLNRHAVRHLSDPRPHKCQFCDAAYPYINGLYRHIKTSHKDKNFVKPMNKRSRVFKPKSVPNAPPLPVMTCRRMYPCEICGKIFPLPCKLKTHLKSSHDGNNDMFATTSENTT